MSASPSRSYDLISSGSTHPDTLSLSSPAASTTDSLPSSSDSALDSDEPELESEVGEESDAEREWKESLQQLELLLTMVLVPFVGKYFGRRCAYWGWTKFMEWKYPVEIVVTSRRSFRAAGIIEAASPL